MNFLFVSGLRSPCDVNIPSTNVAESADVTKNVQRSTIATIDIKDPIGYSLITTKNAVDVDWIASDAIPEPRLNPIPPNTANHMNDASVGARSTPVTNSFIVLPFDILAINVPVNGAQAIHHAQ